MGAILPLCLHDIHDDLLGDHAYVLDLLHRLIIRCSKDLF